MTLMYDETLKDIKTETIVAFLRSKGWEMKKKSFRSFYMIPPVAMRGSEDTHLSIPLPAFQQAEDFTLVIGLVMNTIAALYEIDKSTLTKLFSQSIEEMKADIALKQKLLEFA